MAFGGSAIQFAPWSLCNAGRTAARALGCTGSLLAELPSVYTPGGHRSGGWRHGSSLRCQARTCSSVAGGHSSSRWLPCCSRARSWFKCGAWRARASPAGHDLPTAQTFVAHVTKEGTVGARNTYGHPREEVLARLGAAHVLTYRTDLEGAATFYLDGTTVVPSLAPAEVH